MANPAVTAAIREAPYRPAAVWTLLVLGAAFATFVLPFLVPLRSPVMSQAYTAGANNRAGAVGLALVGLTTLFICCRWNFAAPVREERDEPLDPRYWVGVAIVVLLLTGWLGALVARSHLYWGDAGYFLTQLRTGIVFHRTLYTQFEFPYGPVLYWWPEAVVKILGPLGFSMAGAYMVALTVLQVIGLGLLFYVVNSLPMRGWMKALAFVLVALCAQTPLLGLNYTLFRFMAVPAMIVLLSRQRSFLRAALLSAAGEFAALAISPELGIAFLGGASAIGVYRCVLVGARWIWIGLASVLGGLLFALLAGKPYFLTLTQLAKGAFNLIPVPLPHLIVYAIVAAIIAPVAVAWSLREAGLGPHEVSARLCGLYASGLGLVPAALGRNDPLHTFFNGIVFYLLALTVADRAPRSWRRAWLLCVAFIFALTQVTNFHVYRGRIAQLRHLAPGAAAGIDIHQLEQTIGSAQTTFPWTVDELLEEELTRTGQFQPSFYCGNLGVWDEVAEQRVVAGMLTAEFALIPKQGLLFAEQIDNAPFKRHLRFGYAYPQRNAQYVSGMLVERELHQNWTMVGNFGDFQLWQQKTRP